MSDRKQIFSTGTKAIPENRRAPSGMIWRCVACGKQSVDLFGLIGWHSPGWDESCMLNAEAVPIKEK